MYRASDRIEQAEHLELLTQAGETLELTDETLEMATELYLSELPVPDRSKPTVLASSCYTAALINGQERPQGAVADAFDVSRIAITTRWKTHLEELGLTAPTW